MTQQQPLQRRVRIKAGPAPKGVNVFDAATGEELAGLSLVLLQESEHGHQMAITDLLVFNEVELLAEPLVGE